MKSVNNADLECYEALFSYGLYGQRVSWPLGLGVFLGRGMAVWLRRTRSIPAFPSPSLQLLPASHEASAELVDVLAQMALAVVG